MKFTILVVCMVPWVAVVSSYRCPGSGARYCEDPNSCNKYYNCGWKCYLMSCPDGQVWYQQHTTCRTSTVHCRAEPKDDDVVGTVTGYSVCSSTGDPHYKSFDGKRYNMHGKCTYQAASCGDFSVNFKNIDLLGKAPMYTARIEYEFKGHVFSIERGNVAKVDGTAVQIPYRKTFTNEDYVEIIFNGQLEMRLYNDQGKTLSVKARIKNRRHKNGGSFIDGSFWLHNSCAALTAGICGTPNGNPSDDLLNNNPIQTAEKYQKYDEHCPAPAPDPDTCNLVPNGRAEATRLCQPLQEAPFTTCHATIDIGDAFGGVFGNCVTDVCNCFLDETCGCSQLDSYASDCIEAGIDLKDWRKGVHYCPYECPAGQTYKTAGATPVPTCLNKNPTQTGTVRGCFCPDGEFFQDGECVGPEKCKCLYEGQFYNIGDEIVKKAECQECTCETGGEMTCRPRPCPALTCGPEQFQAYKDDDCCPYCEAKVLVTSTDPITIKQGQDAQLTYSDVPVDLSKTSIVWYKGGTKITKGVSDDQLRLTIKNADAADIGEYRCEATSEVSHITVTFELNVIVPLTCKLTDGTIWEEASVNKPHDADECTCFYRNRD